MIREPLSQVNVNLTSKPSSIIGMRIDLSRTKRRGRLHAHVHERRAGGNLNLHVTRLIASQLHVAVLPSDRHPHAPADRADVQCQQKR